MTSDQAQQFNALPWVRGLVEDTLREARRTLEDHVEGLAEENAMAHCVQQLHQVNGALVVSQAHGAAMLADEMELVARGLADGSIGRKEEAAEVLMLGMVQLPAYLERLESGEPDIPLILLPLLNDLRAARDAPLVSEISLFAPKLDQLIESEEVVIGSGNPQLPQDIRQRRIDYHKALLGWYRGADVPAALRGLRDVLSAIGAGAGTARVRRMVDAADALLVAIAEDTVDDSIAVKLLFGRLDRFFKEVIDHGEEAAAREFPSELLKNLLYYVSRSSSDNPVIEAVRQSADLANSFPESQADLEVTGDSTLMGPGKELFAAVADALHHDLMAIKDDLDLYIRGDRAETGRLAALAAPLQKVADTLGMVGRGDLRTPLKTHSDRVRDLPEGEAPDDSVLMAMAADILAVESALSGLTPPRAKAGEEGEAAEGASMLSDAEMHRHQTSAIQEAFVELARVKESVSQYLKNPANPDPLSDVPARLHGVSGVLRVLQQGEAAEQLERLGSYLRRVGEGAADAPDFAQRETLADVLTGVEYYLEAVQEERPNRQEILDFARAAAARLAPPGSEPEAEAPAAEAPAATEQSTSAEAPLGETAPPPAAQAEPAAAETKPPLEDIDAEILDIFIEESREELANIAEQYPRWKGEQDDREALQTLRRSFHTLKGSGRLVGAATIGEFAWAFENLLNRVIDGRIPADATLFGLLDQATEALPLLVDAQEQGTSPQVDVAPLESQAFAMAEGRAPEAASAPESVEIEAVDLEAPEVEEVMAEPVTEEALPEPESVELEPLALDQAEVPETDAHVDAALEADLEAELEAASELYEQLLEPAQPAGEAVGGPAGEDEEITIEAETVEPAEAPAAAAPPEPQAEPEPDIPDDAPIKLDPVLLDIFRNESATHLGTIDRFVTEAKDKPAGSAFEEDLRRALHTLRGSAHMAEVEPVAEVSGRLENLINLLNQRGQRTNSSSLALLERGRICLQDIVDAINVGGVELPDWRGLADEVQQRIDETEASAESQFVESVDVASEDLETEVLEIFSEEARELLERVEEEYSAWREQPADNRLVGDLQRTLHTFKGGARLAGISTMGDLTHAMESLFENVVAGNVTTTPGLQRLARSALDRVASAVEKLQVGEMPDAEPELIDKLEAAARGEWVEEPSTLLQSELRAFDRESILTEVPPDSDALAAEPQQEAGEAPEMIEVLGADELESGLSSELSSELEDSITPSELESELSSELLPEGEDSTLLSDSQLLTDSELLSDSQLSAEAPEAPPADQARVIPFPGGEKRESGQLVERIPLPGPEPEEPAATQERVRIGADVLDQLVGNAGEISIYRARMEQQNSLVGFNLEELNQTIARLREQLRQLDLETEAQILSRHEREYEGQRDADFDPLEMDQYSNIQQLSRALVETVADLSSIGEALDDLNKDTDTLLLQQSRVNTDLQDSLLRTRMTPFSSRVARLQRVVRQAAEDLGKAAELEVLGASGEMDRSILDRMMGPLEHLLRNAVAHGIEEPAERTAIGKAEAGRITLSLFRDGVDVVLEVQDDGGGMDREAIRERAIERGLLDPTAEIEDDDLYQFVLQPGFSTAAEVSQVAGRGVGMDAVLSEVKQLGGSLDIHSEQGAGTRFTVRLPFTLAIAQTLLVTVGEDAYAVPHTNVDAVVRVSHRDMEEAYTGRQPDIEYGGHKYEVRYLGDILGTSKLHLPEEQRWLPVLLVRSGEHRVAVHVDTLIGNRQIVVKPLGTQLSTVRWFTGGTILADGSVALILDMTALARMDAAHHAAPEAEQIAQEQAQAAVEPAPGVTVMVVDDSITVRKVTSRLLERHNMQVITAKDGVDAVAMLQEHHPDVMLLDIEMPRMDGFELARHMQNSELLNDIPIIMITSRTGEKHRNRAMELGVRSYLGKPYQEAELLDNIYTLLAEADK